MPAGDGGDGGRKFKETAPEAVVIVGNDQREFFDEDLTPSITVYRGKEIRMFSSCMKTLAGAEHCRGRQRAGSRARCIRALRSWRIIF